MRVEDALGGMPAVRFAGQTHAAQALVRDKFTLGGGGQPCPSQLVGLAQDDGHGIDQAQQSGR